MSKEVKWIKIADSITELSFQANDMCIIEVDGKKITIAQYNESLYGFAHKCPHASGIMAEGYINALGNVICPLHRYAFNIKNGRNTTGEGYYLKTYLVENRAEGIYVGIEKSSFFYFF